MTTTTTTTKTKKLATKKTSKATKKAPKRARASGGDVGSGAPPVDVASVVAAACADGFFAPLGNDHPYLKIGVDGLAGVGKTHTLAELAIGLWHRIGSTKPVVVVDTENARRFLVPMFARAGVPVVVRATRSLADWREAVARAEAGGADIVVTDSLTHLWEETAAAYCAARGIEVLEGPSAWVGVKEVWHREWSAVFRDARVHLLFAARSADNYVDTVDVNGKRESVKVGTKVRGEAEIAFEPSLHLTIRRDPDLGVVAVVEKDRTDICHGSTLTLTPGRVFAAFARVVDNTLAGAVAPTAFEERSTASLFGAVTNRSRVRGLVGEVNGLLERHWPARSAAHVQTRANALHQAFGHSSWPKLEKTDEQTLQAGLLRLQAICAAGGPTVTPTPSPDAALATIRVALANDPGDPIHRRRQLSTARALAMTLPTAQRASGLAICDRTERTWEQADLDQRPTDDDSLPC
jgi:hypothetical protein